MLMQQLQRDPFGILRSRSAWTALALFCGTASAQDTPDLHYLLFDPVPIAVDAIDQETGTYTARELRLLPEDESVDLQSWMAAQRANTVTNTEQVESDIARYTRAIIALESEQGPFSSQLPQQLMALAAAHQANGATDQALAIYQRALHIVRVNDGLFSLQQQQVLNQIIRTHLARGDVLAANEQQDYLFLLRRRSAGNQPAALLAPMDHYASWNLFAFNAFATTNPVFDDTKVMGMGAARLSGADLQAFRAQGLLKAQGMYQRMIELVREFDGANDAALPPLQLNLARSCFLYLSNFNGTDDFTVGLEQRPYDAAAMPMNSLCSRAGKDALEERVAIVDRTTTSPLERLAARLDLADWLLYFRKRMEAIELVGDYYTELAEADAIDASMQEMFDPALPVPVPNFSVEYYSRQYHNIPEGISLEYKGYIDLAFSITQYGATRSVAVLSRSPGTPAAVEDRLIRHVRRNQFRPRWTAEGPRNPDEAYVRYYFTY